MGPAFSVPWLYLVQSYQAFSRWRNAGGTGRPDRAGRTRLDRAEPVKQGYLFSGNAFADPPAYPERISPLCGRMQRFLCAVGAFLHGFCGAAGRNRLSYIYQLITPPAKRNRAFPTGTALLYRSLLSVAFGRVRPVGHTLFFTTLHRFLRAASGIRHQHGSGSDAAHPGIVPVFCAGMPCKLARKQCHFPAYCPILSA